MLLMSESKNKSPRILLCAQGGNLPEEHWNFITFLNSSSFDFYLIRENNTDIQEEESQNSNQLKEN